MLTGEMINLPGIGKRAPGMKVKKDGAQRDSVSQIPFKMQTSPNIPKSTSWQCHAYFHKWPLPVSLQAVPGYRETESGLPSSVTVKFLLSARPSHSPRWSSLLPCHFLREWEKEESQKRSKQHRIHQHQHWLLYLLPSGLVPNRPGDGKWVKWPHAHASLMPTFLSQVSPTSHPPGLPVPAVTLTVFSLH